MPLSSDTININRAMEYQIHLVNSYINLNLSFPQARYETYMVISYQLKKIILCYSKQSHVPVKQ